MTRASRIAAAALLLSLAAISATVCAAEVIDRILLTVNGVPITQSEWQDAVNFEALLDGREPGSINLADRQATLNRLVDQALVEQQIRTSNYVPASDQEVAARVAELRHQLPAGANDDAWRAALTRYSLSPADVGERVRVQLDQLRYLDQRFRPTVLVTKGEVEKYYRDNFVPQVQRTGAKPRPLAEVAGQIEQVLTEQHVNALLTDWLQTLRTQAQIQYVDGTANAAAPARKQNLDSDH